MITRYAHLMATTAAVLVFAATASAGTRVSLDHYVKRSAHAGTVVRKNTVRFTGERVEIPVIAVQPGKPDTSYEVHGQVDPTLIVPAGAKLRFLLANADRGMAHGLDVTLRLPPYSRKPALPLSPGGSGDKRTLAGTGVVPPSREDSRSVPLKKTSWFTPDPGTYHYACPVPGHAHKGMHGTLVVKRP